MVQSRSSEEIFQILRKPFLEKRDPLYVQLKELSDRSESDHLEYIFDREAALRQKIARVFYIGGMVGYGDSRILDFGSGCGLAANILAYAGARQVTGVELDDNRRAVGRFLQQEVFGVPNVEFVTDLSMVGQDSHDSLLLLNVVSHLQTPIDTLVALKGVIRSHGILFIEDNNNYQSYFTRWKLKTKVWPGEKRDGERIYADRRRSHLAERHPEVTPAEADFFVQHSFGMTCAELDAAVEHWRRFKRLPFDEASLRNYAPMNPDNGMYHENAFSPQVLGTILFNAGFCVETIQPKYLFDYKIRGAVSWIFRNWKRLSLHASPAFEIKAIKR